MKGVGQSSFDGSQSGGFANELAGGDVLAECMLSGWDVVWAAADAGTIA